MFLGALCCGTPMGAMSGLWASQLFLQIHDAQDLETTGAVTPGQRSEWGEIIFRRAAECAQGS
jgi:hypothetical protein